MIIYKRTDAKQRDRSVLILNSHGIVASYERAAVGGGFYVRNHVTIPWPWKAYD